MARVCVFAPVPILTITIEERHGQDDAEIHLHAGGQGYWIARLIAEFGADVVLCATFGGESGRVVEALLQAERLHVRAVPVAGSSGAYIHDRRSGERDEVASMGAEALSRHEVDDLYGLTLVEGLEADVCVLGGPGPNRDVIPPEVYRRLAADLSNAERYVMADLSGDLLQAAAAGGADVLKVSHEDMVRDGLAESDDVRVLIEGMRRLRAGSETSVVCSRAEQPALAMFDNRLVSVTTPEVEPADPRGTGDSFTAGLSTGLARGFSFERALQLAGAAGSLNATRHGLGSGTRDEVERLARHVVVEDLHGFP